MKLHLLLWVVGGLCLVAACATERSTPRVSAAATPPGDLLIIVGQTGGYAGRLRGYSIRADGRVWQWEGKHVEENILARATIPREAVDSLWRRVQATDFFAQRQQAREAAAFLSVTADGDTRRVSWSTVPPESSAAPLGHLYASCRERARDALRLVSDGR